MPSLARTNGKGSHLLNGVVAALAQSIYASLSGLQGAKGKAVTAGKKKPLIVKEKGQTLLSFAVSFHAANKTIPHPQLTQNNNIIELLSDDSGAESLATKESS